MLPIILLSITNIFNKTQEKVSFVIFNKIIYLCKEIKWEVPIPQRVIFHYNYISVNAFIKSVQFFRCRMVVNY